MPDGDIESYRQGDAWRNRIVGGSILGIYTERRDAVRRGREEAHARGVSYIVREDDGPK